ncbi:MAG: hypothetical protein WA751_02365 [Candidatus Dormiibacterota bacterium]
MVSSEGSGTREATWKQYGRALIHAMAEVTGEIPEEFHDLLLETADYWLSLGMTIGTQQPEQALRLLDLIETDTAEQKELAADAQAFSAEALA